MTTSPSPLSHRPTPDLLNLVQEGLDSAEFELARAEQALAELSRRFAELGAEVASLRIRAEAREAQLRHAQDRLNRLGQAETDVQDILDRLQASGAVIDSHWWDGLGEAEVRVTVTAGRGAEVDAAMLEIFLYPVGVPVPNPGGMSRGYSTDGTQPWEASDEAGGAQ